MNKLTEDDVREIRRRYAANPKHGSKARLAREYGVSHELLRRLVAGKIWRHAGGSIPPAAPAWRPPPAELVGPGTEISIEADASPIPSGTTAIMIGDRCVFFVLRG